MRKTVKIIIFLLVFAAVYWFIIHPKTYTYGIAVNNGDVIMGADGKVNTDKFHAFINNVENKQVDRIRITTYSKEGYPIIFDLKSDGRIIKCTTDNTRNLFGRDYFKRYGEYTKISKNEINDYFLVDESGKYKNEWIFQE